MHFPNVASVCFPVTGCQEQHHSESAFQFWCCDSPLPPLTATCPASGPIGSKPCAVLVTRIFSWSASLLRGIPELCDTSNYAGERNVATKDGRRLMWFHQSSSWSLQTCDGSDLNATCCQAVIAHATSAVVTLIKSCTTRKLFHLVSSSCRVYR